MLINFYVCVEVNHTPCSIQVVTAQSTHTHTLLSSHPVSPAIYGITKGPVYSGRSVSFMVGNLSTKQATATATDILHLLQEDHQTQVETAQQRVDADRSIGRDFIPLSQSPQLSQLTFGRQSRRSSAGVSSSESTAIGAAAGEGGGGGDNSAKAGGQVASGISSCPTLRKTRRSRFSAESSNLVVGGGVTGSAHATRGSSRMTSESSRDNKTVASLGREQLRRNRLMGRPSLHRGVAGRVNDDHDGGTTASASPELLYASGRITAGRYHEILAEIDGRGGGVTASDGKGFGIIVPTTRRTADLPKREAGGTHGNEKETPATTSFGHA